MLATSLLLASQVMFFMQVLHSLEELGTGFHKKWYLFKMPFWMFLLFEVIFTVFWAITIFTNALPEKNFMMKVFLLLMFANGIQHLVWFGCVKKYVPGLITCFLHLGWFIFIFFY